MPCRPATAPTPDPTTDGLLPFAFDEATHTYTLAGVAVPSVTQVLNAEQFIDFSMVPRDILLDAQERGNRVHRAMHYYLERDLDMADVDDADRGYVDSGIAYVQEHGIRPFEHDGQVIGIEYRGVHPLFRYGFTIDCVGLDPDDVAAIDDWKTGEPEDVAAALQTAAYEAALRVTLFRRSPKVRIRRRAVKLYRDGTPGRREPKEGYTDPRDFGVFLAAFTSHNFKRNGFRHVP